jgi:hypothetical protein
MAAGGNSRQSDPRSFEIFRDAIGHWCARRLDGLVVGTFLERTAAIRFVRQEQRSASLPGKIREISDGTS